MSIPGRFTTLNLRSRHLTTGQTAKLVGVAMRTVSKWCDSGKLKSFKLPESNDRRIARGDLVEFLIRNGNPIPPALAFEHVKLAIHIEDHEFAALGGGWEMVDEYALGERAASVPVGSLLIGDACGGTVAMKMAARFRENQGLARVAIVLSDDSSAPGKSDRNITYIRRPVIWPEISEWLNNSWGWSK